jgi:hypothetical protein
LNWIVNLDNNGCQISIKLFKFGGQFSPAKGGQFAPAKGGQFNPALGGQFNRLLQ